MMNPFLSSRQVFNAGLGVGLFVGLCFGILLGAWIDKPALYKMVGHVPSTATITPTPTMTRTPITTATWVAILTAFPIPASATPIPGAR